MLGRRVARAGISVTVLSGGNDTFMGVRVSPGGMGSQVRVRPLFCPISFTCSQSLISICPLIMPGSFGFCPPPPLLYLAFAVAVQSLSVSHAAWAAEARGGLQCALLVTVDLVYRLELKSARPSFLRSRLRYPGQSTGGWAGWDPSSR